jgi:thiamine-monophosphate kinase
MTESEVVNWLRKIAPSTGRGVVLGIGDDCAIYRPKGSPEDLLFTTDQFIEGVHFRASDPPAALGHRALARGLSDIAAMGGTPRFCLLSLTKPRWVRDSWLKRFYRGLLQLAQRTRTVLVGGDLAAGRSLTCDIVVCGSVRRGQAIRRDGARAGDIIYVSGPLGGAAAKGYPPSLIEPRLKLGRQLRASACIDITDGLALDLHRLLWASGASGELERIPLAPGATEHDALFGGEDYELLFTSSIGAPAGCIALGYVTPDAPGDLLYRGLPVPKLGYDHFRH